MPNRSGNNTLLSIVLFATTYLLGFAAVPRSQILVTPAVSSKHPICLRRSSSSKSLHPYHKDPPKGSLPATLDPAQFVGNKRAFVAYSVAAKIPELLYQEPCYCPCNRIEGHESLLDCFTSDHGTTCQGCQIGVIFVYEQSKAGKKASEIREEMERGALWKIDFEQYVETHYDEYANKSGDKGTVPALR
jgi:hypothetical protein